MAVGATLPTGDEEIALGNFERFHAMATQINITDPFIEFYSRWLRRNYPKGRDSIAFLTGDCGQFISDGPEVTCILDVEIGHLGGPMRDLACFRGRHARRLICGAAKIVWKSVATSAGMRLQIRSASGRCPQILNTEWITPAS